MQNECKIMQKEYTHNNTTCSTEAIIKYKIKIILTIYPSGLSTCGVSLPREGAGAGACLALRQEEEKEEEEAAGSLLPLSPAHPIYIYVYIYI